MKHWHVIYTKPKSEYKVAAWLSNYDIESYVPSWIHSVSSSSQSFTKNILFPCYVFAHFSFEEGRFSSIQWTPGIRKFVSFGGQPATIPDYTMEEMRQKIQLANDSRRSDLEYSIKSGTPVRIISGPFQDMQAIFDRPTASKERVQVLLDFLGSINRVRLDIDDLEVISRENPSDSNSNINKRPRRTRGRGRYIKAKE